MSRAQIAFVAGPAVWGETFFGRKNLLNSISVLLEGGMSVLLLGHRRIGKSSIVAQLRHLRGSGSISGLDTYPVQISLDGMTLPEDSSEAIAIAIGRSIAYESQSSDTNSALNVFRVTELNDRWSVLSCFESIRKAGIRILLLFDEMDTAIQISDGEAAAFLRSLISQGHLVAVVTTFVKPEDLHVQKPGTSPWANVLQTIVVGGFDRVESLEMLHTMSHRSGKEFTKRECDFLLEVFGDHPFYLQSVGLSIFLEGWFIGARKDIDRINAIVSATRHRCKELEPHLRYLIGHLPPKSFDALLQVAKGKHTKDSTTLEFLSRLGVVVQDGSQYRLSSGLLKSFLLQLPSKGFRESIAASGVYKALLQFFEHCLDVAIEKTIEEAAKNRF